MIAKLHPLTPLDAFEKIESRAELIPMTDTLFIGQSPYSKTNQDMLNLIVSKELQCFKCEESGKTGTLAELALRVEQAASKLQLSNEERSAS